MKTNHIFIGSLIAIVSLWTACTYNDLKPAPFQVTQTELNEAVVISSAQDTAIVGDPFNIFSDTLTKLHKLRDLLENLPSDRSIDVGTIMVRRAYYYPYSNKRDSLLNTLVMVKRERGYYPEGGDWEYMDIAYDKLNDYKINPNGMLLEVSNSITRGKIVKCANCHAQAGGNDFLFHR